MGSGRAPLQLHRARARTGGERLILSFVDDLDDRVAEIAQRGMEPAKRETYDNGVTKVIYRDPEGNELSFGGAPS